MVDADRNADHAITWRFFRGHVFAVLAGICSMSAFCVRWADLEVVGIISDPMKIVTAIILAIWGILIPAFLTAPFSYVIFRLLERFRALNIGSCILGGIFCAGLPLTTLILGALIIGGVGPNGSEDASPFAGVGNDVMDIELVIAVAFSGAMGGLGFLLRWDPVKAEARTLSK